MKNKTPRGIVDDLIDLGIVKPSELKGCSSPEIAKISSNLAGPLPEDYINFLKIMGKGAGGFMGDIDIFYESIPGLRTQADLILEDELPCLPEDAFVFAVRQGEQFMFFKINSSEKDLKVYHYHEEDSEFSVVYQSFLGFLLEELKVLSSKR